MVDSQFLNNLAGLVNGKDLMNGETIEFLWPT